MRASIEIAVDADESIAALRGDAARLQQIAWNLLTNAVKFTPDGGAVQVRLRRPDDHIAELAVVDTGQGIPRDFLPSMFEPCRQVDGSTTRRHGGLGLGLSIVKHLVEAHGGSITAASDGEGRGATFTGRLPLVPADATPATETAGPPPQSLATHEPSVSLKGLSVLIVDDDEACRDVAAAHLESHGAAVLTAASAAQALELLRRQRVDMFLADVAMPGEDGYELIRKIRSLNESQAASIPAAALTGFARDEDRQRILDAGFQLHLAKPIDARSLVDAVASFRRLKPT